MDTFGAEIVGTGKMHALHFYRVCTFEVADTEALGDKHLSLLRIH
jgi:hypothetical protein